MWVEASAPAAQAGSADVEYRRLLIAQDTGGAIRGPIRGDVYWGAGARAESIAGRMAHRGRLFILLPKPLAQKIN
jgi:membrane-bound lytic murein transglycosylase A